MRSCWDLRPIWAWAFQLIFSREELSQLESLASLIVSTLQLLSTTGKLIAELENNFKLRYFLFLSFLCHFFLMILRMKRAIKIDPKFSYPISSSLSFFYSTESLNPSVNFNIEEPNQQHSFITPLTQTQLRNLVINQCSHGKFYNLMQNVVALPTVLLTACQNLTSNHSSPSSSIIEAVSDKFSVEDMGNDVFNNRFDIEDCCVKLMRFGDKGESLILPNLKLKVLIEAIRNVMEIVFDERFVTFSYGGRVNMGRHTAIRYLKNSVENPKWWFTVSFDRVKFDDRNVNNLCAIIEEKIKDSILIDMIRRLFQCGVLKIEFGGDYLGRGLPQECGLCAILVNVYLNKFDKELQEIRLSMNEKNPTFRSEELASESSVFYKQAKMYAVRYLDEILVIMPGSKKSAVDMKNWVVKYLEGMLELKVDKVNTAIHSTTSEKINFMGFELQSVTPSVLHPPMSEKAVRARKKYLKQKEAEAQELRNAKETNRKKLGLKILMHVFKKTKRSNGLAEFDFDIRHEVRDIFRTWADEVVHEFLESIEERWSWHRKLTSGDFLSLRHIRGQLPEELVDAYDKFQEQVHKHLSPVKARKALEETEMRIKEDEERKYSERTVDDLTRLCMKVEAPIELVRKSVQISGITNHMGRPRPITLLTSLEDVDIIKWYAGVGKRWLDFFCCCHNFRMVKIIVSYHLRFSCILTLAEKHDSTKREAIKHYSKDLKIFDVDGAEELSFPTEREVKMMGDKNLIDPKPVDGALSLALIRLACDESVHSCVGHFCRRTDTIVHRICLLQNPLLEEHRRISRMGRIHESLNQKLLPLCADHMSDVHMGKITLQDIDCCEFLDVNRLLL